MAKTDEVKKIERQRKAAMYNLGDRTLTNLAAAYLIDSSKDYGEAVNSAVEEHAYETSEDPKYIDPETGKVVNLTKSIFKKSRQDGKRYSGNVSEYDLIEGSLNIIGESLARVKVKDVLALMGGNTFQKLKSKTKSFKHADRYVSELVQSENEEEKELGEKMASFYFTYLQNMVAGDALTSRANQVRSGLEDILTEKKAA